HLTSTTHIHTLSLHDALPISGKHVMSIYVQYAPFKLKNGDWQSQRDAFGNTVVKTLSEYAPDLPGLILDGQIITPKDLEDTYGRSEEHTSELQSPYDIVCRLL